MVCERLHENMELRSKDQPLKVHQAKKDHYGCDLEKTFSSKGILIDEEFKGDITEIRENSFKFSYDLAFHMQKVFFEQFMSDGIYNFTAKELQTEAMQSYYKNLRREL